MQFTLFFEGTPAEFGVVADRFAIYSKLNFKTTRAEEYAPDVSSDSKFGIDLVEVRFWITPEKAPGGYAVAKQGWAIAKRTTDHRTIVHVCAQHESWLQVKNLWDAFAIYLQEQGRIIQGEALEKEDDTFWGAVEQQKTILKQAGQFSKVSFYATWETLIEDGLIPEEISDEETEMFVDEFAALRSPDWQSTNSDDFTFTLYERLYQAWRNVQKRIRQAQSTAPLTAGNANEAWWHNGKLTAIKEILHKPPYGFKMEVDYIETSVDLLADWFLRHSEEYKNIEIEGHPDIKIEIGQLQQQRDDNNVLHLYQEITLRPVNSQWRPYSMRVLTYDLEQLARERVCLKVHRQQIDRIVILFDVTMRDLLRTWPTAKIAYPSHYPDDTSIVKDGWPKPGVEKLEQKKDIETGDAIKVKPQGLDKLTERQQEVAEYVADGFKNKEIADILFISAKTAKKHRQAIVNRLRLSCETIEVMQIELQHKGYGKGR